MTKLLKSVIWKALFTWTQTPKFLFNRSRENEGQSWYLRVLSCKKWWYWAKIWHDTFRCWPKCCNFHNLTSISSKLWQSIAKLVYILINPQIINSTMVFDLSLTCLWQKKRKTFLETHWISKWSFQGWWQVKPKFNGLLCK